MPISPEMAESLAKAVVDVMLRAETTMLDQVARRVARGIDTPGWAEAKLAEVHAVRRAAEAEVARALGQAGDATEKSLRMAYNRGVATAGTDLSAIGVSRELAFGPVNLARVEALVAETVGLIDQTRLRILRTAQDGYRDVIARTVGDVATGTTTRRQAAQRALDAFASQGVTGFVDGAGRSWDLASYSEMAVRTGAGRAAVNGHLDRLLEVGQDLVIVSDAPQECEICRPWEGKVLSISGQTRGSVRADNLRGEGTVSVTVDGTVAEARAAGLWHPNCRHTASLFQPGVTRPKAQRETADPQGDADRQELRRLERGTRQWKRRGAVAISDEARAQARRKTAEWQGRIRAHTAGTTAKRQRAREQIGAAR